MGKQEVSWQMRLDDGTKRVVLARRVGGDWRFMERTRRRYDSWVEIEEPSREDWETLLDSLRRRYQRRGFTHLDVEDVEKIIAERFPS